MAIPCVARALIVPVVCSAGIEGTKDGIKGQETRIVENRYTGTASRTSDMSAASCRTG